MRIGLNVHGDIRHLESYHQDQHSNQLVHGDIRHLETPLAALTASSDVHGDIRHLEKRISLVFVQGQVHGDIRHLEKSTQLPTNRTFKLRKRVGVQVGQTVMSCDSIPLLPCTQSGVFVQ